MTTELGSYELVTHTDLNMNGYAVLQIDPSILNSTYTCDKIRGLQASVVVLTGFIEEWAWHCRWPYLYNYVLAPMLIDGAKLMLRGY